MIPEVKQNPSGSQEYKTRERVGERKFCRGKRRFPYRETDKMAKLCQDIENYDDLNDDVQDEISLSILFGCWSFRGADKIREQIKTVASFLKRSASLKHGILQDMDMTYWNKWSSDHHIFQSHCLRKDEIKKYWGILRMELL